MKTAKERIQRDQAIGKRIKKTLEEKHLTQHWLAEKVGVTDKTMSIYLFGDATISPGRLKDIACALEVTVEDLINGIIVDKECEL